MKTMSNRKETSVAWLAGLAASALFLFVLFAQAAGQAPPAQTSAQNPSQTPPVDMTQQPGATIKAESRLVLVDAVVTDKKGEYVHDLAAKEFKVYEDNKEQPITSFSFGSDPAIKGPQQRRYLVLFFDNSTMAPPDQIQAKNAARKFIDANAGPDRLMAVVDFGGALQIAQNFTANADLLRAAVGGVKNSSVDPNAQSPVEVASAGLSPNAIGTAPSPFSSMSNAEADFGARSMLLSIRSLAKNLRGIPGRKMLVLFSSGFPMTEEAQAELTATIDACNKANVAVYALDARGLLATPPTAMPSATPTGSAKLSSPDRGWQAAAARLNAQKQSATRADAQTRGATRVNAQNTFNGARLVLASYSPAMPELQRPGGGGGGTGGGGGRPGGGGGAPGGGGGVGGGGGRGGSGGPGAGGGTGGTGGSGGKGGTGGAGGTGGTGGAGGRGGTGGAGGAGGRGGGGGGTAGTYTNNPNGIYTQPRIIVPQFPPSATTNQQILAALAEGTGGFTIFNTNDLLSGLEKIGREQNEFYLLGYVPPQSAEGSCHVLKVKMNEGGLHVRARSGYCNAKASNVLDGTPVEKQLEAHAAGTQVGPLHGSLEAPYFYTGPNVARVNVAMEIPSKDVQFNKEKGKYHASLNVLGIAYKPDGSIGAKFSDAVNLDFEKDEMKEFEKQPYHYQNQFDAASGEYKLTVVVSAGGDAFGKYESPLKIDSYDGKQLSLGGVVMSDSMQRLTDMPSGLDSALLEDHTPLVVKGLEINPSATNRFKKTDKVAVYTEVYEPLLTSAAPPKVAAGYAILDRGTGKQVFTTGAVAMDEFLEKGSPMIPVGLAVKVQDLAPGGYTLVVMAVDGAGHHATNRMVDFDVTD